MSGHSKWATTKHKKAVVDAKRGKVFTKIIKEITIAARLAGGDLDANPRLRLAVGKAKEANMPQVNIKKAIQKGTGELPGSTYEEITYEGYGPGGVAIIITATTDNKNRTVAEIRHILSKHNGSMGEAGSVGWMFKQKGFISIPAEQADEDTVMSLALDAGAEDFSADGKTYSIYTPPSPHALEDIKIKLEAKGLKTDIAEITMIPNNYVELAGKDAETMLKLMEKLEDNEDVQDVYANFDMADDIMDNFQSEE